MLEINPGLVIWTIITFLVLLVLLKKFAWKPLLDALEKREERIRSSIERAEKSAQEAEQLVLENRKKIEQAEIKSAQILREARELGEKIKSEIIDRAHHQARHMLDQAKAEIEREKEAALLRLRSEVADLAILAAKKVVGDSLNEDLHRKLIDSYLKDLPKN
ncbi:MAG: ATP synthase F0 sector subunit b [Ignavibacteriae bacterium]|nr:MAG: ATP synthase F0 sector subunit b [Ignavibacteriota bacterium]